jgi:hypothetical protein
MGHARPPVTRELTAFALYREGRMGHARPPVTRELTAFALYREGRMGHARPPVTRELTAFALYREGRMGHARPPVTRQFERVRAWMFLGEVLHVTRDVTVSLSDPVTDPPLVALGDVVQVGGAELVDGGDFRRELPIR